MSAPAEGANAAAGVLAYHRASDAAHSVFCGGHQVINAFKSYREAFLLGGEHPHTSVYFLQHYLNNNFNNMTYSRLSVAAILLFTGMMVLVAVLYRMQSEDGEAVL